MTIEKCFLARLYDVHCYIFFNPGMPPKSTLRGQCQTELWSIVKWESGPIKQYDVKIHCQPAALVATWTPRMALCGGDTSPVSTYENKLGRRNSSHRHHQHRDDHTNAQQFLCGRKLHHRNWEEKEQLLWLCDVKPAEDDVEMCVLCVAVVCVRVWNGIPFSSHAIKKNIMLDLRWIEGSSINLSVYSKMSLLMGQNWVKVGEQEWCA